MYAYASERFEEAVRSYPSFVDDFARFKRANAAYRPWGNLTHTYPQRIASAIGVRRIKSRTGIRDL